MNASDKKIVAYLFIALFVIITLWYDFVSSADSEVKALIALFILLLAGCTVFLFNVKAEQGTSTDPETIEEVTKKDYSEEVADDIQQNATTSLEKRTERDYLKQIADDIHLIKIIILVFAVLSVLSVLGTLIYIVNIFSQFPIK